MTTVTRLRHVCGWSVRCASLAIALAFCTSSFADSGKNVVLPTRAQPLQKKVKKVCYAYHRVCHSAPCDRLGGSDHLPLSYLRQHRRRYKEFRKTTLPMLCAAGAAPMAYFFVSKSLKRSFAPTVSIGCFSHPRSPASTTLLFREAYPTKFPDECPCAASIRCAAASIIFGTTALAPFRGRK